MGKRCRGGCECLDKLEYRGTSDIEKLLGKMPQKARATLLQRFSKMKLNLPTVDAKTDNYVDDVAARILLILHENPYHSLDAIALEKELGSGNFLSGTSELSYIKALQRLEEKGLITRSRLPCGEGLAVVVYSLTRKALQKPKA